MHKYKKFTVKTSNIKTSNIKTSNIKLHCKKIHCKKITYKIQYIIYDIVQYLEMFPKSKECSNPSYFLVHTSI